VEFLDLVSLHNLPALEKVDSFSRKVASLASKDISKGTVLFALRGLMSDQVVLRKIFGDDGDGGHRCDK